MANQAESKFLADNGEGLQQLLFGSAQPIDSRGQNALNGPRNLNGCEGSGQFDGAIAHERALIEQDLDHFLHEEGVTFGPRDDEVFDVLQFAGGAEKIGKQFGGILTPERIEPYSTSSGENAWMWSAGRAVVIARVRSM